MKKIILGTAMIYLLPIAVVVGFFKFAFAILGSNGDANIAYVIVMGVVIVIATLASLGLNFGDNGWVEEYVKECKREKLRQEALAEQKEQRLAEVRKQMDRELGIPHVLDH